MLKGGSVSYAGIRARARRVVVREGAGPVWDEERREAILGADEGLDSAATIDALLDLLAT